MGERIAYISKDAKTEHSHTGALTDAGLRVECFQDADRAYWGIVIPRILYGLLIVDTTELKLSDPPRSSGVGFYEEVAPEDVSCGLVEAIREIPGYDERPIIMTGIGRDIQQRCLEAGADFYLPRGFTPDTLVKKVLELLRQETPTG